jgi:hypothetical protein
MICGGENLILLYSTVLVMILLQVLSKSFYTSPLLPSWFESTHYHYLHLGRCTTQ